MNFNHLNTFASLVGLDRSACTLCVRLNREHLINEPFSSKFPVSAKDMKVAGYHPNCMKNCVKLAGRQLHMVLLIIR